MKSLQGKGMKLTVVGCSDAFCSGGRLQTCFHVSAWGVDFLIDCGATSLAGLAREGIDPNKIPAVFITHLHGDHFAGLVWLMLHAKYVGQRRAPLTITGPAGIEKRFTEACEALFPGTTSGPRNFELTFIEYRERVPLDVEGVRVTPFEVSHPSGAPPYALRFEVEGKTLAFSGDTEWVESLVPAAQGADLYITECYAFERDAKYHMNWRTIEANIGRLGARRIMLTHMGAEMLANMSTISHPNVVIARDGLVLEI